MTVRLVNTPTDHARRNAADSSLFERWMICNSCGEAILVCGAVSDLDPRTFRGMACGCRRPRVPWPASAFVQPEGVEA